MNKKTLMKKLQIQQEPKVLQLLHRQGMTMHLLLQGKKPVHPMEKTLFAVDELTGLIWACALMRPSKSTMDLELKSLKKKFKDKRFAAGCSRDVIEKGARMMGIGLDELLETAILAMRDCEDAVNRAVG